jgi:hypothetical protein
LFYFFFLFNLYLPAFSSLTHKTSSKIPDRLKTKDDELHVDRDGGCGTRAGDSAEHV